MDKKILLVAPAHRRSGLLRILDKNELQVFPAADFREAQHRLTGPHPYDLVLTDAELPDGSWRDILQFILDSKKPCEMIVCSRIGDEELWAEVLQCGAYDLLIEPYEGQEVLRIIQSALDNRYMQRFTQAMTAKAS
jgi:two-component system chemotaxis response regulator CheY